MGGWGKTVGYSTKEILEATRLDEMGRHQAEKKQVEIYLFIVALRRCERFD